MLQKKQRDSQGLVDENIKMHWIWRRKREATAFLMIIVSICSIENPNLAANPTVDNVIAFVFAGGVRSFILPSIHESIRYNLIHAFCPPMTCVADVFVRLSMSDNRHEGVDAKGKIVVGDTNKLKRIKRCLERLKHNSNDGKLIYTIVDIGSEIEAREMDLITSNDWKQRIYRSLDPRRYSMYFNRWAAYNMVLDAEKSSKTQYRWVVHARLDMGWGAPVQPYSAWSPRKMYVPDSWYADVPDTFAILPRSISNTYFSLDLLFRPPDVLCFGGPNFDLRTLESNALTRLGFNQTEIVFAQKEDCFKKFEKNPYFSFHEVTTNVSWTYAGISESFLKRKLEFAGISLDKKNLGFTTFFTFIARVPLEVLCFYTEPDKFIPWVKEVQHLSIAVAVACNVMWSAQLPRVGAKGSQNCDVRSLRSKYPLIDNPDETCMIDKMMTDWNFLPFRLLPKPGACLTVTENSSHQMRRVSASPCLDSQPFKSIPDFTGDYVESQLFHMLPLSPLQQRLVVHDFERGVRCLTARPGPRKKGKAAAVAPADDGATLIQWVVEMDQCIPKATSTTTTTSSSSFSSSSSTSSSDATTTASQSTASPQLFRIRVLAPPDAANYPSSALPTSSSSLFTRSSSISTEANISNSDRGIEDLSNDWLGPALRKPNDPLVKAWKLQQNPFAAILPQQGLLVIEWTGGPRGGAGGTSTRPLCLAMTNNVDAKAGPSGRHNSKQPLQKQHHHQQQQRRAEGEVKASFLTVQPCFGTQTAGASTTEAGLRGESGGATGEVNGVSGAAASEAWPWSQLARSRGSPGGPSAAGRNPATIFAYERAEIKSPTV